MRASWGWVMGWAVLIEALVLWPHPPEVPQAFAFVGLDKLVHATLFAVQAALAARALREASRPWWPALVGAIAFGALTEYQQHFIPSRSMELGDFLADSTGALVGLAVFVAWAQKRREQHR